MPVVRRDLAPQRLEHRLRRLLAGRRREGQRLQEGDDGGQLVGGTNRAAEATARSGPTAVAREVSSSARSIEIWRGVADTTPEANPVMAGLAVAVHDEVGHAERSVGEVGVVQHPDLPPDRVEQGVVELLDGHGVERGAEHTVERQGRRAVGQGDERAELRAADAVAAGQEQQQGLVLHLRAERPGRPLLGRTPEDERPVAAVEQVGVAGVPGVDLHEELAARRLVGHVELRPPALGALQRELVHVEPDRRQPFHDQAGGRPAVRRADDDEDCGAHGDADGGGEEQVGHAGGAGQGHDHEEDDEGDVGGTSPRARQPDLADRGRGGRAGHVGEGREAGRGHPRPTRHATRRCARRGARLGRRSPGRSRR